jgi:hypothetical protein
MAELRDNASDPDRWNSNGRAVPRFQKAVKSAFSL